MTRRQIREQIFLLLFSAEFYAKNELEEQLVYNMRRHEPFGEEDAAALPEPDEEEAALIEGKVRDIVAHLDQIDARLNDRTEGWKTSRMGKTELAILRLALYEILYEEEIPVSVAINEAVELAKAYGSDKSSAFVNGVLAKMI